ncbi:hypothetical protein P7K49_031305, partial [Saguinus oedipus]
MPPPSTLRLAHPCMSLLSVVFTASENNEPELGLPASTAVDNVSASPSSVDSHLESMERELLVKLPGACSTRTSCYQRNQTTGGLTPLVINQRHP